MKITKYIIIAVVTLILINSCVENNYEILDEANPGFWVELYATSYVEATKDISTNSLNYDSVDVSVRFDIPELSRDFASLELRKMIVDVEGNIIESVVYASFDKQSLPVDTSFLANSLDELFYGLSFSPDSLSPEYLFDFEAVLIQEDDSELTYVSGAYTLIPVLNGFCPLPILPNGIWLAKNNNSQYTSSITIQTPSPYQDNDDGRFWLSEFGLDWSNWSDVWYSIEFKVKCPVGNDPRYVIELMPDGIYDTGETLTATDRTGAEVTKTVRIMPYAYADSKIVGHYDDNKQEITFEDVPLVDTWWNSDNHTVNLTFKYVEK